MTDCKMLLTVETMRYLFIPEYTEKQLLQKDTERVMVGYGGQMGLDSNRQNSAVKLFIVRKFMQNNQ